MATGSNRPLAETAAPAAARARRRAFGGILALAAASMLPAHAQDVHPYVIRPGDTLIGIARAWLVEPARWPEIQRLNQIRNERRLRPGSTLLIPVDLLRQSRLAATVLAVAGEVAGTADIPAVGQSLAEGASIRTGTTGSIALRFDDGSAMTVMPDTAITLERLRRLAIDGTPRTAVRVERGRVENAIEPGRKPGTRFEIRTPSAIAGVRGTRFRVAERDGAALSEVLEGGVNVARPGDAPSAVDVPAGSGVRVRTGSPPERPVPLLPAPAVAGLPTLQERPVVRFEIAPIPGAAGYRGQIAADASFRTVLREAVAQAPLLRFAGLPDGDYVLRVRSVDGIGLEGGDATHAFRLKARPEPPFPSVPPGRGKIRGESVGFGWTAATEAASYALQVARGGSFDTRVVDVKGLRGVEHVPEMRFAPGDYAWRVASVRADGDRGPWSDPQAFAVFPPPAAPEPPALDDQTLAFRWAAEPGQRFLFQLAADPAFARILVGQRLDQPSAALPRPGPGTYYMRVQATDPDGFVGPYTATQRIEVPEPPPSMWPLLLLLLPILL